MHVVLLCVSTGSIATPFLPCVVGCVLFHKVYRFSVHVSVIILLTIRR